MDRCCEFKYNRFTQIQGGGSTPVETADNLWQEYFMFTGLPSPLRNTTYYCGPNIVNGLQVSDNYTLMTIPTSNILKVVGGSADISPLVSGSSGEGVSFRIWNATKAEEYEIGIIFFNATYGSYTFDGNDYDIEPGDEWCIIFETPNWVTQPTSVAMTFSIFFEIVT